jgi:hypothetical protein
VPTWVSDPAPAAPPARPPNMPAPQPGSPAPGAPGEPASPPRPPGTPLPKPAPPSRPLPNLPPSTAGGSLGPARSDLTRAARGGGGGGGGALRRSAGKYVRAVGGARAAATIMGPSRGVAGGVGRVLTDFVQNGPAAALQPFNLQAMVGEPATEVFNALADVLCPPGGTIDEAIARQAMLAAAAELAANGDVSFDAMTPEMLEAVFINTISRSIEGKLINELGTRAIKLPEDTAAVQRLERQLHDFIGGQVRDAFADAGATMQSMPRQDVDQMVSTIYEQAFQALEILGGAS